MNRFSGAVAQLGERYVRNVQVGGSSPLCSRNLSVRINFWFTVNRRWKTVNSFMFAFENLKMYKNSLIFTQDVYKLTKKFPKDESFGLTSQLRRAASSVVLNIAEGSGLTKTEFKNFLRRARGSVYECVPILAIALNNQYLSEEEHREMYLSCNTLARSISALINSMK
jgi:four helix bundle protein